MTTQARIDAESQAGEILERLQVCPSIARSELEPVAVRWLLRRELVMIRGRWVEITAAGREHYQGLCASSAMDVSLRAWKDEALTGIREVQGKAGPVTVHSSITSAVLSTCQATRTPGRTPEDVFGELEGGRVVREQLQRRLGLSDEEFVKAWDAGAIRVCKKCGRWGLFHRRGKTGWQHQCTGCRKERRNA